MFAVPDVRIVEDVSRRERKKEATRRRLHEAALNLVESRGLSAVTVEEITEAADVAPRTFFNYYTSKEHAVLGHEPLHPERLAEAIAQRPPGETPLGMARAVLLAGLSEVDQSPELLRRQMALVKSEPQLVAAWLYMWSAQRQALGAALALRMGADLAKDHYPALVATTCTAVTQLALHRWCEGANVEPLTAIATELFDCLAAGLPYQPSTRRLSPGSPPGAPADLKGGNGKP